MRDIVENEQRDVTLYCVINGNSELHWMRKHGPPVKPPPPDLIDLDVEPAVCNNWKAWSSSVRDVELSQRSAWR